MLASQSKCTDVIKALLAHPNLDIDLADKVSAQSFSFFIMGSVEHKIVLFLPN